ncbi:hypothetical protein [Spirulina subsalsa]|nr:hypothetical protein [Spirulina subsalsa]
MGQGGGDRTPQKTDRLLGISKQKSDRSLGMGKGGRSTPTLTGCGEW